MRIGFVQFQPVLGDPPANRRAVERLVASAAGLAELLVFPELCSSGYRLSPEEARTFAESATDGPFTRLLCELSARHRIYLAGGLCERDGERVYNSAVLTDPGGLIGLYRKVHLFLDEKDLFTAGDLGFPVFDLDPVAVGAPAESGPWKVGLLICFDWQFPEAWRVLALKGAEVVCHPSNLVLPGRAQRAVPVLAMLNRMFVIVANRTGTERDLSFTGHSLIAGPSGSVLVEANEDAEEIRIVQIDPAEARNKAVTARNDLLADRRPEWYREIVEAPSRPTGGNGGIGGIGD